MAEGKTIWPSTSPRGALFCALLALLPGYGVYKIWSQWHPAQSFYLVQYIQTWAPAPNAGEKQFRTLKPDGSVEAQAFPPRAFHAWLAENVYHSQPLRVVFEWPLIGFGALIVAGYAVGDRWDSKRNKKALAGRHLEGPRLVSRAEFNRLAEDQ